MKRMIVTTAVALLLLGAGEARSQQCKRITFERGQTSDNVTDWKGVLESPAGFEGRTFAAAHPAPLDAEVTDFTGYYVLHGNAPRGFKGFEHFELTTMKYRESGSVPIKPYGFVQAGRKYKLARINIDGDNLSFETVNLGGATYQFSGKRVRSDDPNGPVLSGRLTKTMNGKTAAEAQVEFDVVEGG